MKLHKVTWSTSQRLHGTRDGRTTICGHVFADPGRTVMMQGGGLHMNNKRFCRTCFVKPHDFKAPWLPACVEAGVWEKP